MNKNNHQSLWRWICVRILLLAIGSVIVIAICMWVRFALVNLWILHHMPIAVRNELTLLLDNPATNPARFHQIVDQWWGIEYSVPSIASADWIMMGVLVAVTIPLILILGLRSARPLSAQFSRLASAAGAVSRGQFSTRADPVKGAPTELVQFTEDFNTMARKLARYDRELRASHVAMAHELRSPLTAAIGRLQGVLDGVFEPDPRQLEMVMKQLIHLSRLIEELHLLSLADAGQLSLDKCEIDIAELLRERVIWLTPQSEAVDMIISVDVEVDCRYVGDPFRLGQVFTILMENALRYASERLPETGQMDDSFLFIPSGIAVAVQDHRTGPVKHRPGCRTGRPQSGARYHRNTRETVVSMVREYTGTSLRPFAIWLRPSVQFHHGYRRHRVSSAVEDGTCEGCAPVERIHDRRDCPTGRVSILKRLQLGVQPHRRLFPQAVS